MQQVDILVNVLVTVNMDKHKELSNFDSRKIMTARKVLLQSAKFRHKRNHMHCQILSERAASDVLMFVVLVHTQFIYNTHTQCSVYP